MRLAEKLPVIDGMRMFGSGLDQSRQPIISFDIEGCHPHDICHLADLYGVALRGGHHCAQPLMDALNVMATTRASIAVFNNRDDIDALISALHNAVDVLR